MSAVRKPAVAGAFYPASRESLQQAISECYTGRGGPGSHPTAVAEPLAGPVVLVAPHAGYVYSGATAAWGYAELAPRGRPEVAVILGPNHRGMTLADTIETEGAWETPLGRSPIATDIADRIRRGCPDLVVDPVGGRAEHSLEVQLPFLQDLYGLDLPIVPVMLSSHDWPRLERIAAGLAKALPPCVALIASTDMTHFQSAETAKKEDEAALESVRALDPEGLLETVRRRRISMCGVAPTATAIEAGKRLGIAHCRLLRYSNSGDVSGDHSSVVGYACALAE